MSSPDKLCHKCGRDLRCTMTGAVVYLSHTGKTHAADLFMCFECEEFFVYGLNKNPYKSWTVHEGVKSYLLSHPNVVVAGPFMLQEYGPDSVMSFVIGGDVVPLPSAISYMVDKGGHDTEIASYLKKGEIKWAS
jgi:hypothetical protein